MALRTRGGAARLAAEVLALLMATFANAAAQESGAEPASSHSSFTRLLGAHRYEYDERLDLSLDGSAVIDVNASILSLVVLHGARLDTDPAARLDRQAIKSFFEGPGVSVTELSGFRRHGRRFAHVRLVVADVRRLPPAGPLSWSRYSLDRSDREFRYVQDVGPPVRASQLDPSWTGNEVVAFRVHLPSKINFHNSPDEVERGNTLVWEQRLRDRLAGAPLHLEARMETQSILYRTLWLFAGTFLAALAALATAIWWIGRKGRSMVPA